MKRSLGVVIAVATALLVANPLKADQLRLRVEELTGPNTSTGVVISDGKYGDNSIASPGVIGFGGTIGASIVAVSGYSKPSTLDGLFLHATISSASAGTYRITLEDDGYQLPALWPDISANGLITSSVGSSINLNGWADQTNAMPYLGTNTGSHAASLQGIGPIPATSDPAFGVNGITHTTDSAYLTFADTGTIPYYFSSPYSLFIQATVTFDSPGSATFDVSIVTTPAPGGMLLASVGGAVMGLIAYRRRRRLSNCHDHMDQSLQSFSSAT